MYNAAPPPGLSLPDLPIPDAADFSNRYNTPLNDENESQFQKWMQTQTSKRPDGRSLENDLYDYDLRGWWRKNPDSDITDQHLTDEFKKPNHPSFSDQSKYHGQDGHEGGQWQVQPDGSWAFTPGKSNMEHYSKDDLNDYFRKVEPGNKIVWPGQPAQPAQQAPNVDHIRRMFPGARMAPDGNHYIEDPNRPGSYLRIDIASPGG